MISVCGLFEMQVSAVNRPLPGMTGDPKKTDREYIISQLNTSQKETERRAKEARRVAKEQSETDVRAKVDPEIYKEFEALRRRKGTTY